MPAFRPLEPRNTAGCGLQPRRVHVRDHRLRGLSIAELVGIAGSHRFARRAHRTVSPHIASIHRRVRRERRECRELRRRILKDSGYEV